MGQLPSVGTKAMTGVGASVERGQKHSMMELEMKARHNAFVFLVPELWR